MTSNLDNIRSDLRGQAAKPAGGNFPFVVALGAVIAIGAVVGFMMFPKAATPASAAVSGSAPATKALSKSELKAMRRAEMQKFRETQAQLMMCARTQQHMSTVYQAYSARNRAAHQDWYTLFDPAKELSKIGDMNQLEASAFMLTQGRGHTRDIMQDIQMELGASQTKIDPTKCGQLNSQVQRRALDLKPVPST